MTKIFDIIHLNNEMYMILIFDYLKKGDSYIAVDRTTVIKSCEKDGYAGLRIIATTNKSLGLPLLPAIQENIQDLAHKHTKDLLLTSEGRTQRWWGFIFGYEAAKAKKYTEEDIMTFYKYVKTHTFQEAMNHLNKSTNPLPKQVEVEMEVDADDQRNWYVDCPSGKYSDDEPVPPSKDILYSNARYLKPKKVDNIVQVQKWIYE